MTFDQAAILVLLCALLAVFALDRWRIDLVALAGLAVAFLLGLLGPGQVFSGFADPAVVTVVEILIITQAIARSHLIDAAAARLAGMALGELSLIGLLCALAALLSVFMNNIGAVALILPVTLSLCRTTGLAPGRVLIPLSFATLLGGLCSVIGTPANLIVSGVRDSVEGRPFAFFDFAWVGAPVALCGLVWLVLGGARLLVGRGLASAKPELVGPRHLVAELAVPTGSGFVGRAPKELEAGTGGRIHSLLRDGQHLFGPRRSQRIAAGDLLLFEADAETLMDLGRRGALALLPDLATQGEDDLLWVEAVVLPQSTLVGSAIGALQGFVEQAVAVVAVAPQRHRFEGRLADVPLSIGDVLLLRGPAAVLRPLLSESGCLLLSPRGVEPPERSGLAAPICFLAGIALAALGLLPPEIAFGAVVLALALARVVDLRQAIAALDWRIVLMLAAMIPLGTAVETSGAGDLIAGAAIAALGSSDPVVLGAAVLVLAVAITPFVNNASTAVVLAPVAVGVARAAGIAPDPLLIAVALGASLDFLTPFGHHNNTLVMGIGGYRFRDFARVGLVLTLLSLAVGVAALALFWI